MAERYTGPVITGRGTQQPDVLPKMAHAAGGMAKLIGETVGAHIAMKDTPCEVCGDLPHPVEFQVGEASKTVYVRCQHMLDRESARLALEARCATRDAVSKRLGLYPPPKKFAGRRLADVKFELGGRKLHGMIEVFPHVKRYLDLFDAAEVGGKPREEREPSLREMGAGMFLYGCQGQEPGDGVGTGTGKSMLTAIVANELHERGYYTVWFKLKTLCDHLLDYSEGSKRMLVLEAVTRADLLVLDELIDEKDTSARLREFMRLVDVRIENNRPTIVTSNFDTAWIYPHFESVLAADAGRFDAWEEDGEKLSPKLMVARFMRRFQPPHFKRLALPGPDASQYEREDW